MSKKVRIDFFDTLKPLRLEKVSGVQAFAGKIYTQRAVGYAQPFTAPPVAPAIIFSLRAT